MRGQRIKAAGRFAYQRPYVVLASSLLVVLAGLWGIKHLHIDPDLKALLPEHYPSVTRLEELSRRIGTQSNLIVEIRSPDHAANLAFGQALTRQLERFPELRYVIFHRQLDFFKKNALLYLPLADLLQLRQKVISRIRREVSRHITVDLEEDEPATNHATASEKDPWEVDPRQLFSKYMGGGEVPGEYMEADKGQIVVIKARPTQQTTNVTFTEKLVEKVKGTIAALEPGSYHPQLQATVRGEYAERVGETKSMSTEVFSTIAVAALFLVLVIAVYFRSLRSIFIVFIPVIIASLATLFFGALIYGTFNLVTAFIFAILLGLGIDFSIHALSRYTFERKRGCDMALALDRCLSSTGSALLASALTTTLVFFMLQLGEFRGFSQFGVMAGLGVIFSLLVTLFMVPALVAISERIWPLSLPAPNPRPPEQPNTTDPQLSKEAPGQPAHPGPRDLRARWRVLAWMVLGASVASATYAVLHLTQIQFEYDFTKLGPKAPKPSTTSPAPPKETYEHAIGKVTTFAPAVALCNTSHQCQQVTRLFSALRKVDDQELARLRQDSTTTGQGPAGQPVAKDNEAATNETATNEGVRTDRNRGIDKDKVLDEYEEDDEERSDDPFASLALQLKTGRLLPEERALLRALGWHRLEEMRYFLQGFLSLQSFVPLRQADKLRIIADIRRRIAAKRAVLSDATLQKIDRALPYLEVQLPISEEKIPSWIKWQLEQTDGAVGHFVILWNRGAKADYADSKRLYESFFNLPVRDIAGTAQQVKVAANYFVLVEVIDTLKADGPVVLTAAVLAVFVCLLILFRSLRSALLVLVPLLLAVAWLALAFLLLDWKLNMFSVVAFPLLFGMGIDNGIHIYHRWQDTRSLRLVWREVGGPIGMATVTTFVGFAGLLFADHVGIQTLGLTAALGMGLALVGALVTLPALLYLLEHRP